MTNIFNMHDFMAYMEHSTTVYGAVYETALRLEKAGYEKVSEKDVWDIMPRDKKYVVRNDSSLIAFAIPEGEIHGFRMVGTHGDSPCFKLKEHAGMIVEEGYLKLNVENYGGMIKETWFDRPLSIAGRIVVRTQGLSLETKLIDMKKPLLVIPSLAVHMKKGAEPEKDINTQLHLLPLAGTTTDKNAIMKMIAAKAGVNAEDILGADLYVYPVEKPVFMGLQEELIGSPRLDDLACAYCAMTALVNQEPFVKKEAASEDASSKVSIFALYDNEEVGSQTMQGAGSDFMLSVLQRIASAFGKELLPLLADSFLISADNAHALHPNYTDKADPTNRPMMNKGIVIKYHGAQRYTTNAYSGAYVKALCDRESIPYQTYHNRSDIVGGSTLGNILLTSVSLPAADIGIAQLAMHSAFETAGVKDLEYMLKFMSAFYSVN